MRCVPFAMTRTETGFHGFAHESLFRLSDFAEFYSKTAWDTFANSAVSRRGWCTCGRRLEAAKIATDRGSTRNV
jgi:hypothetical protein